MATVPVANVIVPSSTTMPAAVCTLLTVTVICQCGTGAISALNVFFVTRDLHASSGLFGIAETAMGVGFIIGALAAGRMVRWIGARALTWSGLLATGVLAAGYALQRSFPAGLVMLAIYAIPIAMWIVSPIFSSKSTFLL